jgi:hypothetical protein
MYGMLFKKDERLHTSMKTSHALLAVGVAIAALLAAFHWPEVVKPNNRSVIMPLWRGNIWIGRRPVGDGRYKFDTLAITGDTLIGHRQWFTTRTPLQVGNMNYVMGEPDKLATAYLLPDGTRRTNLWLKLPTQVGDTVSDDRKPKTIFEHGQPIGRVRDVVVVTARDTLIIVPAGRFRCFELTRITIPVVESDTLPTISLYSKAEKRGRAYVTPGIGIIKIVGPFGLPLPIGQGFVWELVAAVIWALPPEMWYPYATPPLILPRPS